MMNEEQLLTKRLKNPKERSLAFKELVDQYQKRLYYHIRNIVLSHEDTNDILQNTFIKVYRGVENFQEKSKLYSWLYRIATNEALTFLKKAQKTQSVSSNEYYQIELEKLDTGAYFDGDEAAVKLKKAIATLPEKQRLIFNMKYFQEMKYEEIAAVLSTTTGGLKASYHHAVKKIKKFILSSD